MRDLDGTVGLERPCRLKRLGDHVLERDGLELERPSFVEVGEQEQVFDEDAHPFRLASDPLHRALEVVRPARRAAGEELGIGADGGERGSQLVRGIRDEPPELALGRLERAQRGVALGHRLLDVREHRVEREPEPADLGALVERSTRRERSPAAIASAVLPIASSGRSATRTTQSPSTVIVARTIAVTRSSTRSSRWSVLSTLPSGVARRTMKFGRVGLDGGPNPVAAAAAQGVETVKNFTLSP